jgi:cystathionine beta-synthase
MAPYIIEGAGKSQPTECLDFSLIDEVIQVSDRDAIECCHQLALDEGLLVGGSSGLNVYAARQVAAKSEGLVVTILCDSGLKYLSKIYDPQFLKQHNIGC